MEESLTALDEVVVKATIDKDLPLNKLATVSARLLSSEEANRYAGSIGDPARMASAFAGVLGADDSRNDIVIRGNSSVGLLWKLDGFDIFNPNHFGASGATGGTVSMLNSNQLTNSDFFTSAFPAEFGNATSGVFDLKLRNGNNEKHEFLAAVGYNGFELGAEGPIGKATGASYLVNARYSWMQFLGDMTGGYTPEYQDLSAKLNIPLHDGQLSVVALAGRSTMNTPSDLNLSDEDWQLGDFGRRYTMDNAQAFVGANYTHRFGLNTRLENRLSFQTFSSTTHIDLLPYPSGAAKPHINMADKETVLSFAPTLHHRISSRNLLQAGLGADVYLSSFDDIYLGNALPDVYTDGKSNSSALLQGYAQWLHRFTDELSLTAGLHGSVYTFSRELTVEPRVGLKWAMSERSAVSLGAGLHSQIQPRQVYFHVDQSGAYTNQNLGSSKSWQGVVGYDLRLTSTMRLKAEAYYQHLFRIPVRPDQPEQSIINLADDYFHDWNYTFVNKGTGKNYGIELTLEKFFESGYYFLLTGSLYSSLYTALDGLERNTRFNGNYALNALGGYEWKLGSRHLLSLNAKASYLGNKRILPATVASAGQNTTYDYTHAYEDQMPAYFRADINLNMKTSFRRLALEYFLEFWNITDHKNIYSQEYNQNRGRVETSYQQGFMPMFGVKVWF
jgi:hypothetical protein